MRVASAVLGCLIAVSAPLLAQVTVTTTSLPFGGVNQDYSASLSASGGSGEYIWSITSGSPPPGVNFDDAMGEFFGNPSAPGTYAFTVQVQDVNNSNLIATKKLSIGIMQIATVSPLPDGNTCSPYSQKLTISDGPPPPYQWSLAVGSAPPGLNLDKTSGLLSGTPSAVGNYNFTVSVFSPSANISASKAFSLTVAGLCFVTTSIPDGDVGSVYRQSLVVTGGTAPFTWVIDSGTLPAGITLGSGTGLLSGTPTTVGSYTFTIRVTDANHATVTQFFTVNITSALAFTTTSPLPSGTAGVNYSTTITATGGATPYVFTTSDPPPGMTLTPGGVLSGSPSAGSFTFRVTVTDHTTSSISMEFKLSIIASGPLLQVSPTALTFTAPFEGDTPPPQYIDVTPVGSLQGTSFQLSIDGGSDNDPAPDWISVKPAGGTAPAKLLVTAHQGSMGASTSNARVLIFDANGNQNIVTVTLKVVSATPQIEVTPDFLHFSAQASTPGTLIQTLGIRSSGGGGVLSFTTSIQGHSQWIKAVNPSSGRTVPNSIVLVNVRINTDGLDVGTYRDVIELTAGDQTLLIPVALIVADDGAILGLSSTGVRFQARQGGGFSNPQTIQVLDLGAPGTSLHWNAEFVIGSDLFSISTSSGTATPTAPASFTATPTQKALQMAPGGYYGLLKISSSQGQNSPLYVVLVLDLASSDSLPLPDPSPAGLVFITQAGKPAPAGQVITVNTSSSTNASFQVGVMTADGANWLTATPVSGTSNSQDPGQITVTVDPSPLTAGIYSGEVDISMSGALRSVNITLIVQPAATITQFKPRATVNCTPAATALTETTLVNNFSVPAGWPQTITVQLNDDCGNPVTSASVTAGFSNGDPALALREGQPAVYSATWQPGVVSPQMAITLAAQAPGLKPSTVKLTGTANQNQNAPPSLSENGTVNVFNRVPAGALAPGMIIEVYGKGLATTEGNPGVLPLPNQFQGTSLIVGPFQVPLYFVSSGQLDVQVAGELKPNQQYPVIAMLNGALSVPVMADIASIQLGIAALPDAIAQHGVDSSYVDAAHPAKPNEVLVVYLSGMGPTDPVVKSGQAAPGKEPLARVTNPPIVKLDGQDASVEFAGLTPGLVGLYQINFKVPSNARTGDLPLTITQNGVAANATRVSVSR